jgi:hypothetical protein
VKEHRPEVADIFRQHEQEFLDRWRSSLSYRQLQTLRDIGACRTATLGAHLYQCDGCQRETLVPNSCLNRHCPKCSSTARDRWLEKHSQELLPVSYSHVVFTLPHELIPLALQNPTVVYGIFFRAVSQALLAIAADPRHLGQAWAFWLSYIPGIRNCSLIRTSIAWYQPAASHSIRHAGSRADIQSSSFR